VPKKKKKEKKNPSKQPTEIKSVDEHGGKKEGKTAHSYYWEEEKKKGEKGCRSLAATGGIGLVCEAKRGSGKGGSFSEKGKGKTQLDPLAREGWG